MTYFDILKIVVEHENVRSILDTRYNIQQYGNLFKSSGKKC